ncbi:MAG TPA: hypothetical protein VFG69_06715 [Nannocystaceae bacterium]|nr:hypothetical protein [Nannocystaceae bacterium]
MKMPRMAAWLEGLPHGLDSYPECQVKGSLLRRLVKSQQLQPHAEHLPAGLLPWFEAPPLVSAWVPEVHMFAMLHALRDMVFDDAKLDEFVSAGIQRMISSPLYRLMFLVVSPKRLLHGIGRRWEQFHRGTAMEVGRDLGATIDAVVTHPANMYSPTIRRISAASFRTTVVAAGGNGYRVEVATDDCSPTSSIFRVIRPR